MDAAEPAQSSGAGALAGMDESPVAKDFIAGELARRKTYFLLTYTLGPRNRDDTPLLERRRAEHVEYLFKLRRHGALVLHGAMAHPPEGDYPVRGLCIFAAASAEAVRAYAARDPMVKEGFLGFEIQTFRGFPGDALP